MTKLLKTNIQIGDSATPTQNFCLSVPPIPDGTIKLARGNFSATTQDILTVDASGNVGIVNDLTVAGPASVAGSLSVTGLIYGDISGSTATTQAFADNTTKLATTNYVDTSVRVNQGWTYLTTSRALATTYYNTTNLPIQVSVRMSFSAGGNSGYMVVAGVAVIYFGVSAYGLGYTLLADVPVGASYRVVNNGSSTLVNWYELR